MADQSWGTVITWETGFFAEITSVTWDGIERAPVETTHLGTTTAKTFDEDELYDLGSLNVELFFVPDTTLPITEAGESCTVNWSGAGSGSIWGGTAFMTGFQTGASMGELMTASATLKYTGALAIT